MPGDDTLPPVARAVSGDDPLASALAPSASSAFWLGLSPPPPPLFFFFFLFLFFFLAPSVSSGECTGSGSGEVSTITLSVDRRADTSAGAKANERYILDP